MTGVSVRTLHYYDNIGLLKPSERDPNGFRKYGKKNLDTLLQILSLKILMFSLVTIKGLLDKILPAGGEFIAQKKRLVKEIDKLVEAKKILENTAKLAKNAPLELVLNLVQVYHAMHYLKGMHVHKLIPSNLRKKSVEYEKRISSILRQVDVHKTDDLSILCTNFLEEAYQEFPDIMRLLDRS